MPSSLEGMSAAGHAHVAPNRRTPVAVDDEVVALGLAADGLDDGPFQALVPFRDPQRRP
jgi:hypothetical protein